MDGLGTYEIDNVVEQFVLEYPDFLFVGAVPIDIDDLDMKGTLHSTSITFLNRFLLFFCSLPILPCSLPILPPPFDLLSLLLRLSHVGKKGIPPSLIIVGRGNEHYLDPTL